MALPERCNCHCGYDLDLVATGDSQSRPVMRSGTSLEGNQGRLLFDLRTRQTGCEKTPYSTALLLAGETTSCLDNVLGEINAYGIELLHGSGPLLWLTSPQSSQTSERGGVHTLRCRGRYPRHENGQRFSLRSPTSGYLV